MKASKVSGREVALVKVVFVCTGNICRSPTAEAVFRHMVREAGLAKRIGVDSAGTHDFHIGEPPDPRSQQHAARRGYDLSDQRARQIAAADFAEFDLLLAMDRGHLRLLQRAAPAHSRERIRLFMEFAPSFKLADVPDPYYGAAGGFEAVLDMIEEGSRNLLETIVRERFGS
ncbi:MAG: low molecular weight protein-tyrosine-phosphatase [Alphaproteobacteria bacterium]